MGNKSRRPSLALVVAVVALIVAIGGTAMVANGGTAKSGGGAQTKYVFKRLPVGDLGETIIAKGAGFKVRAVCQEDGIDAYVSIPNGASVDGVSDVDSLFGDTGSLALTTGAGFQVSSFSIAAKDGGVMSGDLGFDYPGASGIFGGQDKCVAYGHVLVN